MTDKTLRDEFAMAALTGLLAAETKTWEFDSPTDACKASYGYADLMLKQREIKT